MAIYLGLVIFVLSLPILVVIFFNKEEKRKNAIVSIGMFVIFLILALKGDVGSDISGYLDQYYISAQKSWFDVDYVYFEPGYITLTKIFAKSGASFQLFMTFVYGLACYSIYLFIKKYSKNPTLSLLIFICYQFLVFYISGVRQTIAMSLCLLAYMVFRRKTKKSYIFAFLLVFLAMSIHTSAIVFLGVLVLSFIKSKKIDILTWGCAIGGSLVVRKFVWQIVDKFFREVDVNTEVTLAGNFIFLCGVALFMYLTNTDKNFLRIKLNETEISAEDEVENAFFTRMLFVSICAQILFSGHSLLRASMYSMMFIIPGLPNTTYRLNPRVRIVADYALAIFFIALFYIYTLRPNQFELCPYVFFWE